ncbi:hypothetical protein BDQ17DRAFT_608824 [Cyathus striatus]|nr:hypothetical protein BDQ17DRAFT_608824 [Cyathus striatus]
MENLAHDFPLNHRKRKADDNDDTQQPPNPQPRPSPDPSQQPQQHPRQPWIATDTGDTLWSPQVSSPLSSEVYSDPAAKRPRLEKPAPRSPGGKRALKRPPASIAKVAPSKLQAVRHGSDLEDIGIVSTADPGPSSGSLLRARSSFSGKHADSLPRLSPVYSVDFTSPHFPSQQPLINRQTLKELDLDAIMRNPQLRASRTFSPTCILLLKLFFKAMTSFLTLVSNSARHVVAESAISRNDIGPLSRMRSRQGAPASHSTR